MARKIFVMAGDGGPRPCALDLLSRQLDAVRGLYHEIADDLSERERRAWVLPHGHGPGFTLTWQHLLGFGPTAPI